MEMSSVVIDLQEHHHGRSNRIVEEHHHVHSNRIVPVSTTEEEHYKSIETLDQWKSHEEEKELYTLGERLGFEEFFSAKIWRSSMAELLGTAVLAFMSDAITISSYEMGTSARMLIRSSLSTILVAFIVLVTIPVTGGHINPIVSMSFGLMGRIPLCRAVIYILAQCTGGILGALAMKAVANAETEHAFSLGGCTVSIVTQGPDGPVTNGLETSRAFYVELICSFVFLFISRWIAFDAKKADTLTRLVYCFGIGLGGGFNKFVSKTITGASGYSGAGVNSATCFGPAVVKGGHLWDRHWIFWVGPAIASICFYLYTRIIVVAEVRPKENKHDFINFLKACHRAVHRK